MPIFDDAHKCVWSIKNAGAEVWLTTTRPYLSLDGVLPDTVAWLEYNDIPYDGLLFDEEKYVTLGQRVDPSRVVAILDDQDDMIESAEYEFGKDTALMVAGEFNLGVPRIKFPLNEASQIALSYARNWRSVHDR
jgi:hypothetical protein